MEIDRHKLYEEFQNRYPLESLPNMTLSEYTDLVPNESFCNWIESKVEKLGSIWGSNSYKFGIFRYKNIVKDNSKFQYDDNYAWYSRYNASDSEAAFKIVRNAIVEIANAARNHDLDTIFNNDILNGMYKWKIAFLYSDKWLIPIYNQEWLKEICINYGMPDAAKANTADLMRFLIDRRGDKDTFEYHDELLALLEKMKADRPQRVWLYAPGENASQWGRCVKEGVMALGWDEMGDFSRFASKDEILAEMRKVYHKPKGKFMNDTLALWEFANQVKPGDIVFAKKGLYKIVGRGVVEGDYEYLDDVAHYPNIRKVKWTDIGEWDTESQQVQKTLTDISKYPDYVERLRHLVESQSESDSPTQYWWLVASPKFWSFADLKVGQTVDYTVKNDKGNKRRVPANFENAKVGDIVVGYEANPVKKIVALAKVVKASDGETITFEKTEELETPIPWSDFKGFDELKEMEFIKNQNGSFFKLTPEEYEFLLNLIRQENPEPEDANPIKKTEDFEPYSKEDFLSEVFMTEQKLDELVQLLRLKKNVILQGAPGVGKTFSAKRLAYFMMGQKDDTCIEMVQFHQNYSYEDFIMGYRPTAEGGFELRTGSFYNFCKKAEDHPGKDFFFIIDEINRGNLSKIFGELLMLIENSYRGHALRLAYRNEQFSVPENVFIIGMMNTADRSLAMIDYALRRRFSFHSMAPGFGTEGFKTEMAKHSDTRIGKVVDAVVALNNAIENDDSLGSGFCIGHSYFCNQSIDEQWLDSVVKYDICPMLDEYWFDSKDKCETEKKRLLDTLKQ
ncbi:MAG: EVE domain-containing protein [Muribaculum sp.]|nr:EVE domain-containing protein [Muribaculum sp.]